MVVLSLFDGMSCGQIALKELGVNVKKYYASEIDKFAIAQTMLNFPNTIQLGSVVDVDVSKLDKIDLLIGGSPCQSFSFAGKRKGMSTKTSEEIYTLDRYLNLKKQGFEFEGQSYLFWEYMRVLTDIRKINSNVIFLLENVEMGNKWERILSEAIGVFGVHINSALLSAQNRKRIYWTNISTKSVGLFGELHVDIPQPQDKGILLKDVLESDVDEKYYMKNVKLGFEGMNVFNKSNSLRVGGHASQSTKHNFDLIKVDINGKPKQNQYKAGCFTAGGHSGGFHSDMDLVCVAMRGRNPNNPNDMTRSSLTKQRLEANLTGKTNCITSVQKDNLIMQLNTSTEFGAQPRQQNRIYDADGISPALTTDARSPYIVQRARGNNVGGIFYEKTPTLTNNSWDHNNLLNLYYRIRRLTPTECTRLQTVPSWYIWECSETQQYKMLGNGWTILVICHLLSILKQSK